jgi:hypothetical protein
MKHLLIAIMLLAAAVLAAEPGYYPITTIAEDFCATWCPGCENAFAGIDVVENSTTRGEFISARLYTTSGDLSNPAIEDRVSHYQVFGIPTVIMNGKTRLEGGDGVADGSAYLNALRVHRFGASPVKMAITNFNASTGQISGSVEMISPTANLQSEDLVFYLIEDNVSATDTHVTRRILYDTVSLTGEGNTVNFSNTFSIDPNWNQANLWAAVFIQLSNNAIIQTAHTKPLPEYNFRCAFDWDAYGNTGDIQASYFSPPLWFYNMGPAQEMTIRLVVDSAPELWAINYCDDSNCYPGNTTFPLNMAANSVSTFHLNIWPFSSGIATFHFEVTSPQIGTFIVPFRFHTSDITSVDDPVAPMPMVLGQNHPNPFSASTRLTISSEKDLTEAVVEVFNVRGQKVDEARFTNLRQGENSLLWKAPADLPAGVYFQRLKGSALPPRKMLLVK